MYIEHNGYVIMQKKDMRFIDFDCDTTEDVEEAKVYSEYQDAMKDLMEFNKDFPDSFEIVNYHKTIWLDKVDLEDPETFANIDNILNIEEDLPNE